MLRVSAHDVFKFYKIDYFVSMAVQSVEPNPCLSDTELHQLRLLVDQHMAYQEPLLRGAAQTCLLRSCLALVDPQVGVI